VEAHKENIRQHGSTCQRCHRDDFCNNCHRTSDPHPQEWLTEHPKGFRAKPKSCRVCHALPGETGGMSFCKDCHALRRAHGLNWIAVHPEKFRQDPKDCARCHKQTFCSDCHAIYRHHPDDWLRTHPGPARENPKGCRVCHTEQYCQSCHQKTEPKTHDAQWRKRHGAAVTAGEGDCVVCHRPSFCQSCHSSQAGQPKSHDARWPATHGTTALAALGARSPDRANAPATSGEVAPSCRICHDAQFCDSCHGLPMPHPQDWRQAHRAAAKAGQPRRLPYQPDRDWSMGTPARAAQAIVPGPRASPPGLCARCHDQSFCTACHRSTTPQSHQKDWINRHGAQAQADRKACMSCHTEGLCLVCHRGVKMPHPKDWPTARGAEATTPAQQQSCAACHAPSYCFKCHGLSMPHPDNWLDQHGAQAQQHPELCSRCHGPTGKGKVGATSPEVARTSRGQATARPLKGICTTCHEAMAPSGHDAKDWLPQGHFVVGSDQPDLCALCHGADSCQACHAKRGVGQ
jgi:hypothetical protein